MTDKIQHQFFKEMLWDEVRPHFLAVEPKLVAIIDELSPSNKYKFLKVSYPYGAHIFANKIVHLPIGFGRDSVPLSDSSVAGWVKKLIGYAPLPLGVIGQEKGAEFFIEYNGNIHPIAFCAGGFHLGIWEFFEPPTSFTITSGARSLILVPKIMNAKSYIAMSKYGMHFTLPGSPFDQWSLFKSLVGNQNFFDPWVCDVFYFSEEWAKQIRGNPKWIHLKYFILERAWQHADYSRSRFLDNDMWESFIDLLSREGIKPASYLLDIFKHLIYVVAGSNSALLYKAAGGDETAAPMDTILKVFLDVYGLKTYAPTLMIPSHFSHEQSQPPLYCPLQIPIWWNSAPKSRVSISTKNDLEDLVWIFECFFEALKQGKIHLSDDRIDRIFSKISVDFFHSDGRKESLIKPAALMPLDDSNLLYLPGGKRQYGVRKFADRSTFARGCVRISMRNKVAD